MGVMLNSGVLPEPKLEPKFTKSVGFLLRTDFQYTKTENAKTEKVKSVAEIYFHFIFFGFSFLQPKKLKPVPISVLLGHSYIGFYRLNARSII